MIDIRGDDHAAPGHLFHDQRFRQVLPLRHMGHLLGDHPLAGVMHLRNIGLALTGRHPGSAHESIVRGKTQRLAQAGAITLDTSLRRHDPVQVRRV